MIFRQWRQVLDGTKWQTRRLRNEYFDLLVVLHDGSLAIRRNERLVLRTGCTYSVQPGRGKKAIGRIRLTKIRREWVQDISPQDCIAEGIIAVPNQWGTPWYQCPVLKGEWKSSRAAFAALWDSIYKKPGERFDDNPEVWALSFEVV